MKQLASPTPPNTTSADGKTMVLDTPACSGRNTSLQVLAWVLATYVAGMLPFIRSCEEL